MRRVIIAKNQNILRRVCLPIHGNVKVRAGEPVEVGTLIAEMILPQGFEVIDIASHFKVSPEEAEGMIQRLVGDVISKGDVLAQKRGFITQLFRSPGAGKVVSLREGRITLAVGQKKIQAFSPVAGMVTELIADRGAVIALTGSVVEAAWGNGKNCQGELVFWDELEKKALGIPSSLVKDKLIVFKKPATTGQIRRLLRLKPAGIVLPTLTLEQFGLLRDSEIAVISLLGFGEATIDAFSLEMIEAMQGKQVYLLAEQSADGMLNKPLLIMPEEKEADLGLLKQEALLEVGAKVRLRGKPYSGMSGVVTALPDAPVIFASGLQSQAVAVECDDQQTINASIHNIDLIQE